MNLFEVLQQFKNIEPDRSFAEKSKRAILASSQSVPMGAFRGMLRFIETGVAVVLAGFFILLLTGAFSHSPAVSPVQYSVIDPVGLSAEAQAIDMQIQLANINYPETGTVPQTTSPAAGGATKAALSTAMTAVTSSSAATTPASGATSSAAAAAAENSATASGSATGTASSTATISIDQALDALSQ